MQIFVCSYNKITSLLSSTVVLTESEFGGSNHGVFSVIAVMNSMMKGMQCFWKIQSNCDLVVNMDI